MTNAMIILMESVRLMEAGVIGGTGRKFTVQDKDGSERIIEEPEAIHTFAGWKARGFSVKKGEHAVASFPVWSGRAQISLDDDGNEVENRRLYLRKASWFTAAQVEPTEERERRREKPALEPDLIPA